MAKTSITPSTPWVANSTSPQADQDYRNGDREGAPPSGLVEIDVLNYQGAFRIPADAYGVSQASYSYGAIGLNSDASTIYVAGHEYQRAIAEFTIPTLVNSTVITNLNMAAAPIQGFVNVLDKATYDSYGESNRIGGIYCNNGKMLIQHYDMYDQSPHSSTNSLVLNDENDLATTSIDGYFQMTGRSYAAGWVSPVPVEHQVSLGGTHLGGWTSSTERALVHSSGVGPSAYAFNADSDLTNSGTITDIQAIELMKNQIGDLAPTDEAMYLPGQIWTHASEASYGIIVPGTDTYMVLGMSGGNASGMAYGDPPYGGDKGHYTIDEFDRYPYYWLYDVNDLIDAKNGVIDTGALVPYSHGELDLPFQTDVVNAVSGGDYDPATGIMYLSVFRADKSQGSGLNPPVIVAYKFDGAS